MSTVPVIVKLAVILVIIPFLTGGLSLTFLPLYKQTFTVTFLAGYLMMFAVFGVIAVPCELLIRYDAFEVCAALYACALIVMAAAGGYRIFTRIRNKGLKDVFPGDHYPPAHKLMDPRSDITRYRERYSKEAVFYWILFGAILLFQLYMAVTRSSFDGDDAYYVTESVLADETGTMNTILPYTGDTTTLDIRHALAVITMWTAFVARMSGLHAAITAHVVMPLLFLPLTYLVYAEIGIILLRGKHNRLPAFMTLIALLQMFGNVSIYTNETFLMTRTWQGKSVMANLVVALVIWIYCNMFEDAERGKTRRERYAPWILLAMTNAFAGMCTTMGVMLSAALIAALTLPLFALTKRPEVFLKAAASCIPNAVYVGLYLLL